MESDRGIKVNDIATDFRLKNLSGEIVNLSDYRGKRILLNFWVSWCPPCKKEMPYMEKYYKDNKDKLDIEIITVNMPKYEKGGMENTEKFIEEYELTYPVLLDEDAKVMNLYAVQAFPTTYIINKEGIITDKVTFPLDDKMIAELMEKIN